MSSATEKILACIAADASNTAVVEESARLAHALGATWIALYVETPDLARLPIASREQVLSALNKAAELGAETCTLGSIDIARTILEFARTRGITRILVGRSSRALWLRRVAGSMVDTVVAESSGTSVQIVGHSRGAPTSLADSPHAYSELSSEHTRYKPWPRYVLALGWILLASAAGLLLQSFLPSASLVTLYLLAAMLSGLYLGQGPAAFAAITGSLSFNFLFTAPRFTLHIYQLADVVNFGALLTVGLVVAQLSARARHQARVAVQREERAVSLGAFTGALLSAQSERDIAHVACEHIGRAFDTNVELWLRGHPAGESIRCVSNSQSSATDHGLIHQVLMSGKPAGAGMGGTSDPSVKLHYMPVAGADHPIGVLVIEPRIWRRLFLPEPRKALQSYAHQLALALERMQLLHQKRSADLAIRAEDLRNDMLAGLSHDLRTPLASIVGSSSALVENAGELNDASQRELIATIHEESLRMTRLVTNLLEMARLTQGFSKLKREWIPLDELVGSVRHRLAPLLAHRAVLVTLPPALPLAFVDGLLFEQVLQNLLENAAKYSPEGAPIEISAQVETTDTASHLRIAVADRGIGIPENSEELVFQKFHRAHPESAQSGMGLGLALCKSIVFLHGGSIGVEAREGGGSVFSMTLPLPEQPSFVERTAIP